MEKEAELPTGFGRDVNRRPLVRQARRRQRVHPISFPVLMTALPLSHRDKLLRWMDRKKIINNRRLMTINYRYRMSNFVNHQVREAHKKLQAAQRL